MIIGVAVKYKDITICLPRPNRHHDCIRYGVKELGLVPPIGGGKDKQGFYTADGVYLNRKQAMSHVKNVGQEFKREPRYQDKLFSEDLW